MDSSDDDELNDYEDVAELEIGNYGGTVPLSGIHMAIHYGNLAAVKRMIESGQSVNKRDDRNDFTPLHVAAQQDQLQIIEYLLSQKDIEVDPRDPSDITPLWYAAYIDHVESVKMLLQAGADVNSRNCTGFTPLHVSTQFPDVALCLIQNGAEIDALNDNDQTPLHCAAQSCCQEVACMLLYYNADPDVADDINYTPFIYAAESGSVRIQQALNGYVDYEEQGMAEMLRHLHFMKSEYAEDYLRMAIRSDNVESAIETLLETEEDYWFISGLFKMHLEVDTLTTFTCLLLRQGFRVTSSHISMIFSHYGYCELIEILLYMDNNYKRGWSVYDIVPRAIFDLEYTLEDIVKDAKKIYEENVVTVLEYFRYPPLIDSLLSNSNCDNCASETLAKLPRVPLLTELARNAARQHVRESFDADSTCKFYTVIDHLDIPRVCKRILKFQKKLYRVKL